MARSTAVIQGDVLDLPSLEQALQGVTTAYYLVHLMGSSDDFEKQDRQAAENFAWAAREAGTKRIIYLGGLGDDDVKLSPHLRSRHEVAASCGSRVSSALSSAVPCNRCRKLVLRSRSIPDQSTAGNDLSTLVDDTNSTHCHR